MAGADDQRPEVALNPNHGVDAGAAMHVADVCRRAEARLDEDLRRRRRRGRRRAREKCSTARSSRRSGSAGRAGSREYAWSLRLVDPEWGAEPAGAEADQAPSRREQSARRTFRSTATRSAVRICGAEDVGLLVRMRARPRGLDEEADAAPSRRRSARTCVATAGDVVGGVAGGHVRFAVSDCTARPRPAWPTAARSTTRTAAFSWPADLERRVRRRR